MSGLEYLHRLGIIHRDLKLENVLIKMEQGQPIVKIADFGLGKLVEAGTKTGQSCGTFGYTPPEIL